MQILQKQIKKYLDEGYLKLSILNSSDINFLQKQVKKKLNSLINKNKLKIKLSNLSKYHEVIQQDETHNVLMNPDTRYINLEKKIELKILKKTQSILKKVWKHNKIKCTWIGELKNKKQLKYHATGFRIARPISKNKTKKIDVADVHIDMNAGGIINNDKNFLVTLWIPLIGFNKKYTLNISPRSHKLNHKNKFKKGKKITYSAPKGYAKKFNYTRNSMQPGEALLLNPNLLHGGSHNLGSETRLSLDCRIINHKKLNLKKI